MGVATGQMRMFGLDYQFFEWIRTDIGMKVKELFIKESLKLLEQGRKRYSAKGIIEYIRFNYGFEYPGSAWKINNNMISRLVRLVIKEHPELAGFFELRRLQG